MFNSRTREFIVPKTPEGIQECIEQTLDTLQDFSVDRKSAIFISMRLEELLLYISSGRWKTGKEIKVCIRKLLDEVSIRILLKGERIAMPDVSNYSLMETDSLLTYDEENVEAALNQILVSSVHNRINIRYHDRTNDITLYVQKSKYEQLRDVAVAMVLGLFFGYLLKTFVPDSIVQYISTNILANFNTMFMNAIKMLVGPMVFCSIVSCISEHSNIAMLEKISKYTLIHYLADAIIAILLAIGVCMLVKPGSNASVKITLPADPSALVETASNTSVSLWETIRNIVPSNIFASFHNSTILQIIFIAILFGLALSQTGGVVTPVKAGITGLYKVFGKMMNFIMTFLPVMVFCSMAQLSLRFGISTLKDILYWLILIFASYLVMILIYAVMVWIRAGIRPAEFFKKVFSCLLVAFSMGSSSAAMSTTMETCEKELGINKKIYAFTVPLGVSIHCASSCIFYIISTIFLLNLYRGCNAMGTLDPVFYVSVLLLAVGAPSVSGSGPICVAMLLSSIGVPMQLVSLILAWDPLVSTIKTSCSCMEDLSVSTMVSVDLTGKKPEKEASRGDA